MEAFIGDIPVSDNTRRNIGDVSVSDNTRKTTHHVSSSDKMGIGYLAGQAAGSQQENKKKHSERPKRKTEDTSANKSSLLLSHRRPVEYTICPTHARQIANRLANNNI